MAEITGVRARLAERAAQSRVTVPRAEAPIPVLRQRRHRPEFVAFGTALNAALASLNISLRALAVAADIDPGNLSKCRTGSRQPTRDLIDAIVAAWPQLPQPKQDALYIAAGFIPPAEWTMRLDALTHGYTRTETCLGCGDLFVPVPRHPMVEAATCDACTAILRPLILDYGVISAGTPLQSSEV